jgi:hypothetical protein
MPNRIKKPNSLKENRRFHVCADHKWATHSANRTQPTRSYKADWQHVGGQRSLSREEKLVMTERREEATGMHE